MATLALLHKLMKIDAIQLPLTSPLVEQSSKKKQIGTADNNFIRFYHSFLLI